MGNLVDYAKDELKRIGMIDSGEPYNDLATKAILDLIELFDSQGHSGFTAPYVESIFHRLAMFKPISPLTGEDDEWNELGDGSFQNKRYSAVFKDKDGNTYDIDGKVFSDDDGETWYTCRDSRVDVTFPYVVPDKPEYVYRNDEPATERIEYGTDGNPYVLSMTNGKELGQESCHFCSMIYPDTDVTDIVFGRGKYSNINFDSFITFDNEGKYCITIDPGDPYELGYLVDIKFCPYCGRKLKVHPIKTVTNAEEAEEYQISEDISKGFEEFTRMMFKQGQGESEDEKE